MKSFFKKLMDKLRYGSESEEVETGEEAEEELAHEATANAKRAKK